MSRTSQLTGGAIAITVAVGLAVVAYGGGNVAVLAGAIVLSAVGVELSPRGWLVLSIVTIQLLFFVGVSIAYLAYRDLTLADIGVKWPSLEGWIALGAGYIGLIVLWLAASIASFFVADRFGIERTPQSIIEIGQQDPFVFVLLAVLSVLIVGPAEELLFRGVIQTRLRETFGVVVALTVATALFALIHVFGFLGGGVGGAVLGVSVLFVIGSVLAVVYEYTGNLVVVAILHGLFNATQGAFGYFSVQAGDLATVALLLFGVA